jgi:hypothetical protein
LQAENRVLQGKKWSFRRKRLAKGGSEMSIMRRLAGKGAVLCRRLLVPITVIVSMVP